jgi:hypothetical protein
MVVLSCATNRIRLCRESAVETRGRSVDQTCFVDDEVETSQKRSRTGCGSPAAKSETKKNLEDDRKV